jgi:hypothetical protein
MTRSGRQPGSAASAAHGEIGIETKRQLDHVPHQGIVVDMKNAIRFHTGTHLQRFPRAVFARQGLIFSWRSTASHCAATYHGVVRPLDAVSWWGAGKSGGGKSRGVDGRAFTRPRKV